MKWVEAGATACRRSSYTPHSLSEQALRPRHCSNHHHVADTFSHLEACTVGVELHQFPNEAPSP